MLCLTLRQRDLNSEISTALPSTRPFTIGRAADVRTELLRKFVSRIHAKVTPQDGSWLVEDLDSRNGIFDAQGRRVQSIVLINEGDTCWIAAPRNALGAICIRVVGADICECDLETIRVDLKAWSRKAEGAIDALEDLVSSHSDDAD